MQIWSNSSVLPFIDSIAVASAQGYMLARTRLTSHPSPVLRLAAGRDAMAWNAALLERELAVFRQERELIASKQRPHYTPTNRGDEKRREKGISTFVLLKPALGR